MSELKSIAQDFIGQFQPRIGTALMRPIRARIGNPVDDAIWVTDGNLPQYKEVYVHIVSEGDPLSYATALLGGLRREDVYLNRPVLIVKTESGFYKVIGFDDVEDAIFSEGIETLDTGKPVYLRQLVEIATLHPITGSLRFRVSPAKFPDTYFGGLDSDDFATETVQDTLAANIELPDTNGLAKGVLVQLDIDNEVLEYKQSSTFDSVLTLPQAYKAGLLPEKDTDRRLLGYLKLVYGQTLFSYETIWQTPELLGGAGGNVTGTPPNDTYALARFTDLTGTLIDSAFAYLYDTGEMDLLIQDASSPAIFIVQHASQTFAPLVIADSGLNHQIDLLANGGAIFNEEGNDVDFRIETDTNANAFFVDGGSNNVGMGTGTPNASAMLDIVSTAKGLGLPSMTTAQRNAIGTPRDGLIVYDSDLDLVYVRANGAWVAVGSSGTITGTTGATDNRLIRADGTGGSTIQSSAATLDDNGALTLIRQLLVDGTADEIQLRIQHHAGATANPVSIEDSSGNVKASFSYIGGLVLNEDEDSPTRALQVKAGTNSNTDAFVVQGDDGRVGIGGLPDDDLVLDIQTIIDGGSSLPLGVFGLPEVTTSEANALAPRNGAMGFNTTLQRFVGWAGGNLTTIGFEGADGIPFVDPTALTWTNLNQGSGTYTEDTTTRRLIAQCAGTGTAQLRGWYASLTPPFDYRFYTQAFNSDVANNGMCIGFRENASGELHVMVQYHRATTFNPTYAVQKWNSATSLNSNYIAQKDVMKHMNWFRLVDNNTSARAIYVSEDGTNWQQIHSIGRTDFLTADQIFFGLLLSVASADDAQTTLLSAEDIS